MNERQEAKVANCTFFQSFFVTEDNKNPLTPDTVFVDGQCEIKSFLTKEDCEKYQRIGDQKKDAFINAITTSKPFLGFWTRKVPVVTCSVHSCIACKNQVVKKQS